MKNIIGIFVDIKEEAKSSDHNIDTLSHAVMKRPKIKNRQHFLSRIIGKLKWRLRRIFHIHRYLKVSSFKISLGTYFLKDTLHIVSPEDFDVFICPICEKIKITLKTEQKPLEVLVTTEELKAKGLERDMKGKIYKIPNWKKQKKNRK